MIVDRTWAIRNLGYDPVTTLPPSGAWAHPEAVKSGEPEDFEREIIDFDSEAPHGQAFMSFSKATGLSRFTDVPWPAGLAPVPAQSLSAGSSDPLPRADVLVVTWTVDEGHALSRVLTPGKDSRNDWLPYTHGFAAISKKMRKGCPALELGRLGTWWTTTIGATSVVLFKSDSHMSQDGPQLPNVDVWKQIIHEVRPKLVLTTGTAGGIGAEFEVGDVAVSPVVHFDCISRFKAEPFAHDSYDSVAPNPLHFGVAAELFNANAPQLPSTNTRPPTICVTPIGALAESVVTTDFFGFDTSDNHYQLEGLGHVSEMGDAVLGLVAKELGHAAPRWLAVRNVSDPQIKADGLTLAQQGQLAAQIYKGFGRWSSVCSAIVCWALIAAE